MRILHTSDWHLGRLLFQQSLLDDQALLLEQVYNALVENRADVLIIAGDIFDRANPKRESVKLFDDFVTRVQRTTNAALVIIPGNHDAPERIGYGNALHDAERVLVRGPVGQKVPPLVLEDGHGKVVFSALPFSEVFAARAAFGDDTISTPADVLKAQMAEARSEIPPGVRWVIAAHAFVAGSATSESERPLTQVGGVETVTPAVFEGAHYVALGHIHRAQSAGAPHIRYCGSWMGFGFDEAGVQKSMSLVDLDAHGRVVIEPIPLVPHRALKVVTGNFAELRRQGAAAPSEDFVKAIITDEGGLIAPADTLREFYPNLMQIERPNRGRGAATSSAPTGHDRNDPAQVVDAFLSYVRDEPNEPERALVAETLEQLRLEAESH